MKRHAAWILFGLLAFYGIISLLVSAQESATFDEKAHIPSAYSYVRYGDMRLNPEHPPLLKDLAGLPLLFLDVKFPLDTPEWQNGINEQWTLGDLFMNCTRPDIACNDSDAILFWSRLPITLVALLLGLFLFFWGRELGGALAGLIAAALFVLDPNTIAHGHYVTTDIGRPPLSDLRTLRAPLRPNEAHSHTAERHHAVSLASALQYPVRIPLQIRRHGRCLLRADLHRVRAQYLEHAG